MSVKGVINQEEIALIVEYFDLLYAIEYNSDSNDWIVHSAVRGLKDKPAGAMGDTLQEAILELSEAHRGKSNE